MRTPYPFLFISLIALVLTPTITFGFTLPKPVTHFVRPDMSAQVIKVSDFQVPPAWNGKTLIVQFASQANREQFTYEAGDRVGTLLLDTWLTYTVESGEDVNQVQSELSGNPLVLNVFLDLLTPFTLNRKVAQKKRQGVNATQQLLDSLNNNPLFPLQWYLYNTGQTYGLPGEDMKSIPTFVAGFTGRGVTVGVYDDGIDLNHPDFIGRVNLSLSYDYVENVPDPSHKNSGDGHGTATSGMLAANDDDACVAGTAFEAMLAIVRVFSNLTAVSDSVRCVALTANVDAIDVHSNSYEIDSSFTNDPAGIIPAASEFVGTRGRNGKGGVLVFPSGNGRLFPNLGNAEEDLTHTSPYVITVGGTSQLGKDIFYSNPGANVFIGAPTADSRDSYIVTSDRLGPLGFAPGDCFLQFAGTSSCPPMVSGVVAQMFEANADLMYRDVLHILSLTAEKINPNGSEWQINTGNRSVSHLYGFGNINAQRATALAQGWTNVPPKEVLTLYGSEKDFALPFSLTGSFYFIFNITCTTDLFLEHLQVNVDIAYPGTGDLSMTLVAPSGTQSYLKIAKSSYYTSTLVWPFMTVMHWGESSKGVWYLIISNLSDQPQEGVLNSWSMTFYGIPQPQVPPVLRVVLEPSSVPPTLPPGDVGDCCTTHNDSNACSSSYVTKCLCQLDIYCCLYGWVDFCAQEAEAFGCLTCPVNVTFPTPAPTMASPTVITPPPTFQTLHCNLTMTSSSAVKCSLIWSDGSMTGLSQSPSCQFSLPVDNTLYDLHFGYVYGVGYVSDVSLMFEVAGGVVDRILGSGYKVVGDNLIRYGTLTDWTLSDNVLSREATQIKCI